MKINRGRKLLIASSVVIISSIIICIFVLTIIGGHTLKKKGSGRFRSLSPPIRISSCRVWGDGGSKTIEIEDSKLRTYSLTIVDDIYGSKGLFVGSGPPGSGDEVASGSEEEEAIHDLLMNWLEQHQDVKHAFDSWVKNKNQGGIMTTDQQLQCNLIAAYFPYWIEQNKHRK